MNMNDIPPEELHALSDELHQVLLGAVRAAANDKATASRVNSMRGLTRNEWKNAASALLMARRTSVLEALSTPCLEAISQARIDVPVAWARAAEMAIEDEAARVTGEIAAKRWNVDLDDSGSTLHSLDTSSLNAALMDAFLSGAARRTTT